LAAILLKIFLSPSGCWFGGAAKETAMIGFGLLFGSLGLVVLAVRLFFSDRRQKEPEPWNGCQIEMLDTVKEFTAVSSVLDWQMWR
jgi:hypothetical protein